MRNNQEEYMSVSISRDGVVTSHNAFDANFDEMVAATRTIIETLQVRIDHRLKCPFAAGKALRETAHTNRGEVNPDRERDTCGSIERGLQIAIWELGHINTTCFGGRLKRPGDAARKALRQIIEIVGAEEYDRLCDGVYVRAGDA